MKDFKKAQEAINLLRESGVKFIVASENEEENGFFVNAEMKGNDFLDALSAMVSGTASQAKAQGAPEEAIGLQYVGAVMFGVKDGYGTLNKDEL